MVPSGRKHFLTSCLSACALAVALLGAAPVLAELQSHQIKAAYLYQISKFVFWPDDRKAMASFNVCQLGEDKFAGTLDKMQGRQVFNKPVSIKQVATLKEASDCHLLVISNPSGIQLDKLKKWLKSNPVLTVVDGEAFVQKGMVAFVLENQRIRLHINLNLAEQARLSFAANLLEVASQIYREDTP